MVEKIQVLYAEDNPQDADLTITHFSQVAPEFEIAIVETGEKCLEMIKENGYDLLLLDYHLPDMDGIDVLKEIVHKKIMIPVVMVTGMGDEELVVKTLRMGAIDYVPKDIDYLKTLPTTLKNLFEVYKKKFGQGKAFYPTHEHFLYVEHDKMDIDLTLRDFSEYAPHATTDVVHSCTEALQLLSNEHDYDIVLTDLRMPDMNGLEFLKELRKRGISIPVIILTGKGDEETAVAALKLGASDYIVKRDNYLTQLPYAIDHAISRFKLDTSNYKLQSELLELNRSLEEKVQERTSQLMKSEKDLKLFRTLINKTNDAIIVINPETSRIIDVNDKSCSNLGFTREELLTKSVIDIEEMITDLPAWKNHVKQVKQNGYMIMEGKSCRKDGSTFFTEVNVNYIPGKEMDYMVAVVRDMTERKELEAQFLQSQKMEAVGRCAGGIAHDFNNLLTSILGYADLLLHTLQPDQHGYHESKTIFESADRASQLTRQLLAFSRKQVFEPVTLNPNGILKGMSKMFPRLLGEDVHIQLSLHDELRRIKADPGHLEQIFLNLVVNARDAMPHGGKLLISTKNESLDPTYARFHPGVEPGDYIIISVTDTGVGMTREVQERIFEPFYTTKKEGTGLGLSTVYGIVKQLNGHIYVYSELKKGTTLKIYIPALGKDVLEDEYIKALEGIAPGGKETILVLEDEASILDLTVKVLSDLGYQVHSAINGEEALKKAHDLHYRMDLLLSDIILPDHHGPEIAEEINTHNPDIKILFMSGYADDRIAYSEITDKKIPFLSKPFSPYAMSRKVREVLDHKQELKEKSSQKNS